MKKLYILLLLCSGVGSFNLFAQETRDITQLLELLSENHMGSIYAVFSEPEILVLRNHFGRTSETSVLTKSLGAPIFATEDQSGFFGNFTTTSPGTFNQVSMSPVPDFEGAGVIDFEDGIAYMIDDNNNLWGASVFGAYNNFGMVTPPNGETFTGLEINPISGNIYALSTDGMGSTSLSLIDPDTQTVTPVGLTGMVLGIALMIDLLGNGYGLDIDTDTMWKINLTNGVGTIRGSVGFDANFGQGGFLDSSNGLMYLAAFNNDSFDSELRTVDPETGNTTLVGTIIDGVLAQMGWASMNQSVLSIVDESFYDFSMSPVPSTDYLDLKSAKIIEHIAIYNMLGQLISEQDIDAPSTRLDVQTLAIGTYILKVKIAGEVGANKFIKQ